MTKALREAQIKEKMERYPRVRTLNLFRNEHLYEIYTKKVAISCLQVVLRVQFPDRHILQGFFRPMETGVFEFAG